MVCSLHLIVVGLCNLEIVFIHDGFSGGDETDFNLEKFPRSRKSRPHTRQQSVETIIQLDRASYRLDETDLNSQLRVGTWENCIIFRLCLNTKTSLEGVSEQKILIPCLIC